MDPHNLAIVIAPSLFASPDSTALSNPNLVHDRIAVLEYMINEIVIEGNIQTK